MIPSRAIWGAPGGVGRGHTVDDVTRHALHQSAEQLERELGTIPPHLFEMLMELGACLQQVDRMCTEMGPERMADDVKRQELRRASALAGLVLQQEFAFLSAYFAPDDPEAEAFAPAASLSVKASTLDRRLTRMDALRQAYLASPHVPDTADRVSKLAQTGTRLFKAVAEASGVAAEPVPLAEARQAFDRAYMRLRDTVRALMTVSPDRLTALFPDLDPAWRQEDLRREVGSGTTD